MKENFRTDVMHTVPMLLLIKDKYGWEMMENVQCGSVKNVQESNTAYKAGYKHG